MSQNMNQREQRECIASVDLGSTYLRAGIYDPKTERFYPLILPIAERDSTLNTVGANGQIPAVGRPFDDNWANPARIGTKSAMHLPNSVPVKYFLYFLSGVKVEDLGSMPQVKLLYRKNAPADFKHRLRTILEILFRRVADKLSSLANSKGLKIKQVALTYPPMWPSKVQDEYQNIVGPLFPSIPTNDFHFVSEAEACARLVSNHHSEWLHEHDWHLIVDVGGHSLNVILIAAMMITGDDGNGSTQFSCLNDGTGAAGGGELWNHKVLEFVKAMFPLKYQEHQQCLTKNLVKVLKQFINGKQALMANEEFTIEVGCEFEAERRHEFTLTPEEMMRLFTEGFREPATLFEQEIEEALKRASPGKLHVILTGGSLLNGSVRAMFESKVAGRARVTLLYETFQDTDWNYGHAEGAAIAVANAKTVPEFLANAGFGMQFTNKGHFIWSEEAHPLSIKSLGGDRTTWEFVRNEPFRMKILCDAFHKHRRGPDGELPRTLSVRHCYDFWDFRGTKATLLDQGKYKLTLDFEQDKPVQGEGILHGTLERFNKSTKLWTSKANKTYQLYFRAGDATVQTLRPEDRSLNLKSGAPQGEKPSQEMSTGHKPQTTRDGDEDFVSISEEDNIPVAQSLLGARNRMTRVNPRKRAASPTNALFNARVKREEVSPRSQMKKLKATASGAASASGSLPALHSNASEAFRSTLPEILSSSSQSTIPPIRAAGPATESIMFSREFQRPSARRSPRGRETGESSRHQRPQTSSTLRTSTSQPNFGQTGRDFRGPGKI